MSGIFKAYDIRGIYNENLTEKHAYLVAYYFAKFKKIKEFKIAHDLRLSHESLTKYFIKGILDTGAKPIYLGPSSTPNFYFSLFQGCNSGVQITASHNPKEYNGFKLIHKGTSFDSRNGLDELSDYVYEDKEQAISLFEQAKTNLDKLSLKEFIKEYKIKEEYNTDSYIQYLTEHYNKNLSKKQQEIIKEHPFAIDFSSGVSSLALVPLLKKLGLNPRLLNEKPNGKFPSHEPAPRKAQKFIKKQKFNPKPDFIVVFDGDGDRVFLYNENKELVFSDYTIAILMDHFIKNKKSSTTTTTKQQNFIVDLRASKVLHDMAKKSKVQLHLQRVGRSFYQDYMKQHDLVFGGELSGHLFFKEFNYLDNPDIALIHLLEIIAHQIIKSKKEPFKLSTLVDKYKKYYKIEETNLQVKDADKVIKTLQETYKDNIIATLDGISIQTPTHWFNIRKSNTEPIIRINFEGKEKTQTTKEFNKLIKEINLI